MNTKYLREVTNDQLEKVRGLPEEAHYWDVYLGLEDSILIIQVGTEGWLDGGGKLTVENAGGTHFKTTWTSED